MKNIEIGIIGNPNSGKTTLFNALTGEKQRVGNWPGVTVEQKVGYVNHNHQRIKIVDLPGTYSLTVASTELSIDERIACDYLLSQKATVIVNVLDASNLERNLYLTLQLLEMGVPVIVALNMMDIAKKKSLHIDVQQLAKYLGCPVVAIEAVKKRGLTELKDCIFQHAGVSVAPIPPFSYPVALEKAVNDIVSHFFASEDRFASRRLVVKLLEGDCLAQAGVSAAVLQKVEQWQIELLKTLKFEPDIVIAEARYAFIGDLMHHVLTQSASPRRQFSSYLDKIVLNRFLGLPIFFMMMYVMFMFAINIGGAFQDFFDISSDAIFIQAPSHFLEKIQAPNWLIALLALGVGKGINTVMTFIPVICSMFLALSFLEQSGYMARAAFVVDRLMRLIGLPGKSFVPMIVGFGCNVPAVLATRTLESKRDRILTVMMSPFMSCGARLAIFAVFTAVFFPHGGATIVFALYMIGIFIAILTGFILRNTLLKGESSPFVLELPNYHWPTWRSLYWHTWHRLRGFVLKAGILIIPICALIEILNGVSYHSMALLAIFGQWLTPVFYPMGIESANWPATVGLLTGLLAKEVVVGTLNSLYMPAFSSSLADMDWQFAAQIKFALMSIPHNFAALGEAIWNPVLASAPIDFIDNSVMGRMYQLFRGRVAAVAYLLFVLLYFPCVSTTVAIAREIGQGWAWFSVLWTTYIAYGVAVFFYQAATWADHPMASSIWLIAVSAVYFVTFYLLKRYSPTTPISMSGKSSQKPRCGGCIH